MKKTTLILVAAFFIVSVASLAFAVHQDLLTGKYGGNVEKAIDSALTPDQQKKIVAIKKAYMTRIEQVNKDIKEIESYFTLTGYDRTGYDTVTGTGIEDASERGLIMKLQAELWEKRSWLSYERKAFEAQVKEVAPNIPYYVLKML